MKREKDFWDCKDSLQKSYDDLADKLEYARETYHQRVDALVECKHRESVERLQEICEFWAGDIAQIRAMRFDLAERISELEVA